MFRHHSCKSGGWGLECPRHGAERNLLAPIGKTRYPPSGMAAFAWLREKDGAFRALPNDHECPNKNVLAHENELPCTVFCVPKDKTNPLAIRFPTHGGIRTRDIGELNPIEQNLAEAAVHSIALCKPPSAYALAEPRAPPCFHTRALLVSCKHILPYLAWDFTEKKRLSLF